MRKCFNVVEDSGSSGGKARHRLKPRINERKLAAPHQIGKHSHNTRHQPRSYNNTETLLLGDAVGAWHKYHREATHQKGQQRRHNQRGVCRIDIIDIRDTRRHQHKSSQHQQSFVYRRFICFLRYPDRCGRHSLNHCPHPLTCILKPSASNGATKAFISSSVYLPRDLSGVSLSMVYTIISLGLSSRTISIQP